MWRSELAMNTTTADSRIGSHNDASGTMRSPALAGSLGGGQLRSVETSGNTMRFPGRVSKTYVLCAALFAGGVARTQPAAAQTCGTSGEREPVAARASLAASEQDAAAALTGIGFG